MNGPLSQKFRYALFSIRTYLLTHANLNIEVLAGTPPSASTVALCFLLYIEDQVISIRFSRSEQWHRLQEHDCC